MTDNIMGNNEPRTSTDEHGPVIEFGGNGRVVSRVGCCGNERVAAWTSRDSDNDGHEDLFEVMRSETWGEKYDRLKKMYGGQDDC